MHLQVCISALTFLPNLLPEDDNLHGISVQVILTEKHFRLYTIGDKEHSHADLRSYAILNWDEIVLEQSLSHDQPLKICSSTDGRTIMLNFETVKVRRDISIFSSRLCSINLIT